MIEKLQTFTTANGAPFPFDVESVTDLLSWSPRVRCVAVDGNQYRLHEGDDGKVTADALRRIIAEKTGGELTEHTQEAEADQEEAEDSETS